MQPHVNALRRARAQQQSPGPQVQQQSPGPQVQQQLFPGPQVQQQNVPGPQVQLQIVSEQQIVLAQGRVRRARTTWTDEEVNAIEQGLLRYRGTCWSLILKDGQRIFNSIRTQVDLKDKARNEKKRRQRLGLQLGGFMYAPDSM